MLTKVDIITEKGETVSFPLQNSSNGYLVKEVLGLDPVAAEIVSNSHGTVDGAQFQGARRETRNIVIKLGYNSDYVTNTISSLRLALYSKLMPKSSIKLRFYMDDDLAVEIAGKVETFEAPLFVQEPEATISVLCLDPDFYDLDLTIFEGASVSSTNEVSIEYDGNIDTGFIFRLLLNRTLSEFMVYHHGPDNVINTLEIAGANLIAGDVLEISTKPGAKGVWLIRNNVRSSVLYNLSPMSSWIKLSPGENFFRVYIVGTTIPYEIEYRAKYGGL